MILRTAFCYPREKSVDFHNIYFLSGAKDALIQGEKDLEEYSETQMNEWELRMLATKRQSVAIIESKDIEIGNLEKKINALRQQIAIEEGKKNKLLEQMESSKQKNEQLLADKDAYIAFLERHNTRTHSKKELVGWLEPTLNMH